MTIENIRLPVGRIVAGNPAKTEQKTNMQTKQPVVKDGKPVSEWRCKIAIPKQQFNELVWPLLVREAALLYPQINQNIMPRDFAWKFVDGDSPECPKNSKVPYNQREGYPGNVILTIATEAFAPPIFKYEGGTYRQLMENEIKTGDYVVANVNIKAHCNNDGGIYLNPNGFELVGYGTAIAGVGNSNPNEMFGGQTYQLPSGASAMPVGAPAGVAMPTMGQAPMAPMMPTMGQAPMAPLPPPARDFVQNAGNYAPQMGFTPPAAPAAPAQQYAPQMANTIAQPVTSFPTNGIPGIPQR